MLGKMVACSCLWGKEMQQKEGWTESRGRYESPKAGSSFPSSACGGEFGEKLSPSVASHRPVCSGILPGTLNFHQYMVVFGASGQGSLAGHPAARGASAGAGSAPPRAQEKSLPSGLGREGKLIPSFEGGEKDRPAETEGSSTQPQDQSAEWQRDGLPLARRVL